MQDTLPQDVQERINSLRVLEPNTLNPDQLAFLKARRDYLSEQEVEKFGLSDRPAGGNSTPPADIADAVSEAKPARKAARKAA